MLRPAFAQTFQSIRPCFQFTPHKTTLIKPIFKSSNTIKTISNSIKCSSLVFNPSPLMAFNRSFIKGTLVRPSSIVVALKNNRYFSSLTPNNNSKIINKLNDTSAGDIIEQDHGLSNFIGKIYKTTGLSIVSMLTISYGMASTGIFVSEEAGLVCMGGSFFASMASIVAFQYFKYDVQTKKSETKRNHIEYYSINTTERKLAYGSFIFFNSLMISPLIAMAHTLNPMIVPAAAGITGLIMSGASLYAYKKPNGSLLSWQAPLAGCVVGLIGMGLVGIGSHLIMGPNLLSSVLMSVEPYIGICIFSLLTASDTQKAIALYQEQNPDHLGCAANFYLNFINLLIRIIEILSKVQGRK